MNEKIMHGLVNALNQGSFPIISAATDDAAKDKQQEKNRLLQEYDDLTPVQQDYIRQVFASSDTGLTWDEFLYENYTQGGALHVLLDNHPDDLPTADFFRGPGQQDVTNGKPGCDFDAAEKRMRQVLSDQLAAVDALCHETKLHLRDRADKFIANIIERRIALADLLTVHVHRTEAIVNEMARTLDHLKGK